MFTKIDFLLSVIIKILNKKSIFITNSISLYFLIINLKNGGNKNVD
jgi:hypothetical protein